MISLIVDTFTFSSIRQIAALVVWTMPALEVSAVALVLVWFVMFLTSETVEAIRKVNRHRGPRQ